MQPAGSYGARVAESTGSIVTGTRGRNVGAGLHSSSEQQFIKVELCISVVEKLTKKDLQSLL